VTNDPVGFWSFGPTIVTVLTADIVENHQTIGTIKEKLEKFTSRLLWTGNAKSFLKQPMG